MGGTWRKSRRHNARFLVGYFWWRPWSCMITPTCFPCRPFQCLVHFRPGHEPSRLELSARDQGYTGSSRLESGAGKSRASARAWDMPRPDQAVNRRRYPGVGAGVIELDIEGYSHIALSAIPVNPTWHLLLTYIT